MEIIKCNSYLEFKAKHSQKLNELEDRLINPDFFYRGQANIGWGLESTLERVLKDRITSYNPVLYTKRLIELYASQNDDEALSFLKGLDLEEEFIKINKCGSVVWEVNHKIKEFWIHARHHGMPSPLLDLTESPEVGAYFAYSNSFTEEVAIFLIVQANKKPSKAAVKSGDRKILKVIYPRHIKVERHLNQKSLYFTTTLIGDESNRHSFQRMDEHSLVKDSFQETHIYKFEIKADDFVSVLTELDENDINEQQLFV